MFRVAKYSLVALPLFAILTTAACGDKKPPATPSVEAIDASTPDMPATPSTASVTGDAGTEAATAATPEPPAAPAALALPTATAKIALKGKKPGAVELKSDGNVTNGGKPVGKVAGMALQSPDGKNLLTVAGDGAVTAGEGAAYGSFTGDELTFAKGDKLAIGDDGAVTMTTAGKGAPLGKFENLGSAKRAAILAVAFIAAPPAAEKPAAATPPAKPAGKPAGKPAPKK
jgi:hypothetical protein